MELITSLNKQNEFDLSELQQLAFEKYCNKENLFITGPGGSGKSALIKKIVEDATSKKIKVQVCGLTGCAAVLLTGCKAKTLHSFAGIGLANGDNQIISFQIATNKHKSKNWKKVDLLIIDEVSMMSEKIIELLDLTAKKCRKNNDIFGGIQIIFSGDFFQLPPVGNNSDPSTSNFCFESPKFNELFPKENQIYFKKIFRQKDPLYSKILNQIRVGKMSPNSIATLNSCVGKKVPITSEIKPTIILPLKKMVDKINQDSLEKLETQEFYFDSKCVNSTPDTETSKTIPKSQIKSEFQYLESNTSVNKRLVLKKKAQVMCIANLNQYDEEDMICNGSQGIVVDFQEHTGFPIVKFRNGTQKVMSPHSWESEQFPSLSLQQIPLILSWAITIHKAQGASIEVAEIDVGNNIFAAGQTYVALSRVVSLDGLYLRNFDYKKIKVNKKVKLFYENLL